MHAESGCRSIGRLDEDGARAGAPARDPVLDDKHDASCRLDAAGARRYVDGAGRRLGSLPRLSALL